MLLINFVHSLHAGAYTRQKERHLKILKSRKSSSSTGHGDDEAAQKVLKVLIHMVSVSEFIALCMYLPVCMYRCGYVCMYLHTYLCGYISNIDLCYIYICDTFFFRFRIFSYMICTWVVFYGMCLIKFI